MRYFLEISYNGQRFHGWQIQPNAITVQEVVEKSLSLLLRSEIEVVGCGRTDTGVHASSYFLHFDSPELFNEEKMVYKLNGVFPHDIAALRMICVRDEAHARFDATKRSYEYFIHTRKDPFLNDRSMFVPVKLDVDLMNKGAQILLDTKDFGAFCKSGSDVNTTLCDLMVCKWTVDGHQLKLDISANRFLRNMVRAVVGTLLDLGQGKIDLAELQKIVDSGERKNAGSSADAQGLFLSDIQYPYI